MARVFRRRGRNIEDKSANLEDNVNMLQEKGHLQVKREISGETKLADDLILDFSLKNHEK